MSTEKITQKELDAIRAAAEKATKGPWEYLSSKEAFARPTINAIDGCYVCYMLDGEFSNTDANANFIALTDPTAILQMCDRIKAQDEALAWIALQPCQGCAEGTCEGETCRDTDSCITEYCLPCYATQALKGGK